MREVVSERMQNTVLDSIFDGTPSELELAREENVSDGVPSAGVGIFEEELACDRVVALGKLWLGAGSFGDSIAELHRESRKAAVNVELDDDWSESNYEDASDRNSEAYTNQRCRHAAQRDGLCAGRAWQ